MLKKRKEISYTKISKAYSKIDLQLIAEKKKKSKLEKILFHTKLIYITALLFHIVATQIQAPVILWYQLL